MSQIMAGQRFTLILTCKVTSRVNIYGYPWIEQIDMWVNGSYLFQTGQLEAEEQIILDPLTTLNVALYRGRHLKCG